jgi:hypothetical protein
MDDDFDDGDPDDGNPDDGDDRTSQVRGALLKALAVVVVIGVVIALGTTIMVRALGLDQTDSPGPVDAAPSGPAKSLPTTALPVPGDEQTSQQPSTSATPDARSGAIRLDASPTRVRPMERVNLTGTYKGADNLVLKVQRFESGRWSDFGVDATVRVGTFATYVQTGRPGEQRFRVYDPVAKQGSNVVMVSVG